jgi:hypothetical protein
LQAAIHDGAQLHLGNILHSIVWLPSPLGHIAGVRACDPRTSCPGILHDRFKTCFFVSINMIYFICSMHVKLLCARLIWLTNSLTAPPTSGHLNYNILSNRGPMSLQAFKILLATTQLPGSSIGVFLKFPQTPLIKLLPRLPKSRARESTSAICFLCRLLRVLWASSSHTAGDVTTLAQAERIGGPVVYVGPCCVLARREKWRRRCGRRV